MRLVLEVRDLVLATWPVEQEAVARVLPNGLEPIEVDGRYVVTVAGLRYVGGRVGRLPVPPFRQLNVRVYVRWEGEPAVFFVSTRTSALGLGGSLLGAPYRYARLRIEAGCVRAPGLGFRLDYEPTGPGDPGPLGSHELGLFEAGGVRGFHIRRSEVGWREAELTQEPRTDLLVAYGLTPTGAPGIRYAERGSFEAERPRPIASSRSSGSSA